MRNEHTIVTCLKCCEYYDMDFDEGLADEHRWPGGWCINEDEDWEVTVIPCEEWKYCECSEPSYTVTNWTNLVAAKDDSQTG